LQRRPNARHSQLRLLHDELSFEPEHAVTQAPKHAVPAGVSPAAAFVARPIHFYYQASGRSDEVSDEAPAQRHLPAESNAQFLAGDEAPESGFWRSRRVPHAVGSFGEDGVSFR
jgi:hypothetical protein